MKEPDDEDQSGFFVYGIFILIDYTFNDYTEVTINLHFG
jgi:hypothetical protein